MTATTFEERLARIEKRLPEPQEFTPIRFAATQGKHRPKAAMRRPRGVGRNLASMATGTLSGILIGVLIQGAVLPGSPWGPGTAYGELVGMAGMAGFLLSLPMVLMSVYLRRTRPGFFFFSVAYAVAAIATALI